MSEICIIDTSVFCSILKVPNRDQHHAEAISRLRQLLENAATLLLPLATIYETGNHIAQNGNGDARRKTATAFVSQVQMAFTGEAPWTPTPLHATDDFVQWLAEFPNRAVQGMGLGDLSILKTWEQQCQLHPAKRVYIWSHDKHLGGYDRPPRI